jgi:transcription-repair coupling factor (superfamily II helicase)
LRAIQEFTQLGSGYQLAMRDMEIRGVGNLLGVEQSGQMDAIGFDLYMDMLEEEIAEIRGQEIPKVDDTQVDLKVTAFVPNDYIDDTWNRRCRPTVPWPPPAASVELTQIAADLSDRYGSIPHATEQLVRVLELKLVAKQVGFCPHQARGQAAHGAGDPHGRARLEDCSSTTSPAISSRGLSTAAGKVTVRGLGVLKPEKQLENLTEWLGYLVGAVPEPVLT